MTQTSKVQIPADSKTFVACEVDAQWNVDGDYFSRVVLTATDDMPSRMATITMPEDAAIALMRSLALQLGYLVTEPQAAEPQAD
jgi:hypothetical protein